MPLCRCVLGGIREPIAVGQQVEYVGTHQSSDGDGQEKAGECFVVTYNIEDQTATIIDRALAGHLRTVSIGSIRLPAVDSGAAPGGSGPLATLSTGPPPRVTPSV